MNYIEQIFERCNINKISNFLLYGSECCEKHMENYYARNKATHEKLNEWLKNQFTDFKEFDKQSSYLYSLIYEIENIYMQIGLQAGIMLSIEFKNKQINNE